MNKEFPEYENPASNKEKSKVDADLIMDIIAKNKAERKSLPLSEEEEIKLRKHYESLITRYNEMELTLDIADKPMQRICQVLTNNGFKTIESCDGHGKYTPRVFFICKDQDLLRELANTLLEFHKTHFSWHAEIYSSNPDLNPDQDLQFILCPSLQWKRNIDPEKDYETLLTDLDIIGISIMERFDELNEYED